MSDAIDRRMLACGCAAANEFVMYPCKDHAYLVRNRDQLVAIVNRLAEVQRMPAVMRDLGLSAVLADARRWLDAAP